MILKNPKLFYAYIGHAQFVNFKQNLKSAYHKVYKLAESSQDSASIEKLNDIGIPPYEDARNLGLLLRIVKKYEHDNSVPAPDSWWKPSPEYDNKIDSRDRYNGDDYSFLYFAGHKNLGIKSMAEDVDFEKESLEFKIPVFFIEGGHDILTSKEINKVYFDKINAPEKEYFLVANAGHSYNNAVIDKHYKILTKLIMNKIGYNKK